MILDGREQTIPGRVQKMPHIGGLWEAYRGPMGFEGEKMGRTPGENRPNFDICPVFAVRKGDICIYIIINKREIKERRKRERDIVRI